MKCFTVAYLVAFSLVLGCANQNALQRNAAAQSIQVTETWQDLLSQPAIPLEKGIARLGIEASQAPYRSGVLLYCLTDGFSLPQEWSETNRLGPLKVVVQHEDDNDEKTQEVAQMGWYNPPDIRQSITLFRRSIPLDRPGKFFISFLTLDDQLVGQTIVTATRPGFHPWMPIERSPDPNEVEYDDRRYDAVGQVRNRAKGIAIPRFEGMEPLPFKSDGLETKVQRRVGEKLPTLFPTYHPNARDSLAIRLEGTDLIIESRESIILARPDWHFLVRWWVNDKHYIPEQMGGFADQNGINITGKTLRLYLDFLPERIGAKEGDKVDLQLLYCKNGWELVMPMAMMSAFGGFEGPELLISNRVRIEWEKDINRQPEN